MRKGCRQESAHGKSVFGFVVQDRRLEAENVRRRAEAVDGADAGLGDH